MLSKSAIAGTGLAPVAADIQFYQGDSAQQGKEDSVGYLLTLAHRALLRNLELRLQPLDLTANQWAPLLAIVHGHCDTVAACARETGIDPGAMTRMLDRLEDKGLVRRQRNDDDRRVVNVALTTGGRRIVKKIPPIICDVLNQHLRGFSRHEFELMKNLLQRFLANGELPSK